MAALRMPSPTPTGSSSKSNKRSFYLPLTSHGMPKRPRDVSPAQPHRFSTLGTSPSSFISPPSSPRSPGPRSPPMSAKSFGTFIDSEPSTPAYSPRLDDDWDNSTLVLLRPMSSSSAPSSPTEPAWDMVAPMAVPTKTATHDTKGPSTGTQDISVESPSSSHPTAPVAEVKKIQKAKNIDTSRDIKIADMPQKETQGPTNDSADDETNKKSNEEENIDTNAAPFGKLATRVKLILRRRTTGEKKREKKEKESPPEVDRMEDVHWTEM